MYIIQAINKYSTPYFHFCRFCCVLHVYTTTLFSCNSQLSPRIVVNTCLCPREWHWLLVVICSLNAMFQTFRADTECQQYHELLISLHAPAHRPVPMHLPPAASTHLRNLLTSRDLLHLPSSVMTVRCWHQCTSQRWEYSGAWKHFLAVTPPITMLSYFATKFTITHVRSVINFMQGVSTGNLVNVCGVCQRAPLLHNSYFKLLRSYILVSFIFSHWFL